MEMQNMSGLGIKDCLTEASLGWKCFGNITNIVKLTLLRIKMLKIFFSSRLSVGE